MIFQRASHLIDSSFLLKKNKGFCSGKSASSLLTFPVHPVKPGGKKPSATRLPTVKSDHQHWRNKDSRKSRLSAIPCTCVHLKATAFGGNVPAEEIQPTQFHILSAESSHWQVRLDKGFSYFMVFRMSYSRWRFLRNLSGMVYSTQNICVKGNGYGKKLKGLLSGMLWQIWLLMRQKEEKGHSVLRANCYLSNVKS